MTTLIYRGQKYDQHNEAAARQPIELTYRRHVYANRRQEVTEIHRLLTYRGHQYQK